LEIYRAVKINQESLDKPIYPRDSMRAPGNVPYVVDNLWEWKRPEAFPNRRTSVFANPSRAIARKSGAASAEVYWVEFKGQYNMAQLKGVEDSKYHPECDSLKKLVLDLAGKGWPDLPLEKKMTVGRLWLPCLTKQEMDGLFETVKELKEAREQLLNSIRYWEDVELVTGDSPLRYRFAEVFFEAKDGYFLRKD
jgi:hypothetical protein